MALTLAITPGAYVNNVAGQPLTYVASVTNSGATSVTLQSLSVSGPPGMCSSIGQPQYLTPNVPVSVGNPVLVAGSTYNYTFEVVFQAPSTAGPSPQAAGGTAGVGNAMTNNTSGTLLLQSLSSDSTVASASLKIPILSSTSPFPVAQGGALQLASGFDLINFLTTFA